jgi:2,3,4,5-tetrahydropyridine-2-carboxylate N-succinyltransferase
VVIPGVRAVAGSFARAHGLGSSVAIIAKWRSASTDARTALEEALR